MLTTLDQFPQSNNIPGHNDAVTTIFLCHHKQTSFVFVHHVGIYYRHQLHTTYFHCKDEELIIYYNYYRRNEHSILGSTHCYKLFTTQVKFRKCPFSHNGAKACNTLPPKFGFNGTHTFK